MTARCGGLLCQSDISKSHFERGGFAWEDSSVTLESRLGFGAFSQLIDTGGPVQCGQCHT